MVPEGWEIAPLRDLAEVQRGKFSVRPRNDPRYFGGEYPFVQTGDVSRSWTYLSGYSQTLNDDGLAVSKIFPKNTILITIAANIGDVALTTYPVACPDSVVGINVKPEKADTRWLIHRLQLEKDNLDRAAPKMAQKNINLEVLRPLPLLVPPLAEQRKIADILSTWDRAIETSEALLATAQKQKRALMQHLLTGKRRFPEFEGQEWKEVRLGKVLREVRRPVDWSDDDLYRLISVRRRSGGLFHREDLYGREIKTKTLKNALAGDFLISKMQVVHGAMGLVCEEFDGMQISGSYIAVVSKDLLELRIEFFDWLSRMPAMYHQTYLCSYGVHIEKMTFNFGLFLREKIKVPSTVEEQTRIVEVLECAEHEESELETQIQNLRTEKRALMQQLLTGKRRVTL
jgi:type I restriction enzyme, S subunit